MRILVTGSQGFIGKNLTIRLSELGVHQVSTFDRSSTLDELYSLVDNSDFIFHLAGENRPKDEIDFQRVNVDLTSEICKVIRKSGRRIPLVFVSSAQATFGNSYGKSKLAAEEQLEILYQETNNPIAIFRLPGVFGKWCKPNYNSVVATFCNNIANEIPIQINDPNIVIDLVYIDDVVNHLANLISHFPEQLQFQYVSPQHQISLGDLAKLILKFKESRNTLITERVGNGLNRALYSTYISYLPVSQFSYELVSHADLRGTFVEMLKTPDCGQFSYFTAHPGVTRGGHYHHTKSEKFLVIKGRALFRFRQIQTNEIYEIFIDGSEPEVVETIPGWSHDITNIGSIELIVMLWANEIFDRQNPDTISAKV